MRSLLAVPSASTAVRSWGDVNFHSIITQTHARADHTMVAAQLSERLEQEVEKLLCCCVGG